MTSITCLNCGGKGYIVTSGDAGLKQPITCPACKGTGIQRVRA